MTANPMTCIRTLRIKVKSEANPCRDRYRQGPTVADGRERQLCGIRTAIAPTELGPNGPHEQSAHDGRQGIQNIYRQSRANRLYSSL